MKNFIIIMALFTLGYLPAYFYTRKPLRRYVGWRLVTAFTLATLAGFVAPATPVFFLCLALLVALTVQSRVGAACQYILLAGLVVLVDYRLAIGSHYLGFYDQLVVIGLSAFLIAKLSSGKLPRSLRGLTVEDGMILTIFLIMGVGGYGLGDATTIIRAQFDQGMLILLPYFFLRFAVRSPEEYRRVIACFGFSAVLLSFFAIYEARHGWSIFEAINYHLGSTAVSKSTLVRGSHLRAPATMQGPLALGCYLTIGLIALACSRDFFRSRFAYGAALAITGVGFLAAQSRGSLIALTAALLMLCIAWRRWGLVAFLTGTAAAGAAGLYTAARFSPSLAAFLNVNQHATFRGYYDYRQLLFDTGVAQIKQHPLTGMRLESVLDAMSNIKQGEHIVDLVNVYLVILLISGLVGFVPFLIFTALSLRKLVVGYRRIGDPELLKTRAFCMASFMATLIQLSFMSFIDRIPLLLALSAVGARLVSRHRRAAVRRPRSEQTSGQQLMPAAAAA